MNKIQAMLCEKGFNAFGKSIDPCQPVQSVQADNGTKLFTIFKFSASERTISPGESVSCISKRIL